MTTSQSDWHYIAEQASTEMEADKLLDLVTHLHNVLAGCGKTYAATQILSGFRSCD